MQGNEILLAFAGMPDRMMSCNVLHSKDGVIYREENKPHSQGSKMLERIKKRA